MRLDRRLVGAVGELLVVGRELVRVSRRGGQVLDGAFATVPTPLNSGDIVAGGKAQGQIVFEVPVEEGHQYIIWKPNAFNASRAIVQVK